MLIVRTKPNTNGSLANQFTAYDLPEIPEGWAKVPEELEPRAKELLPWMSVELKGGRIVGVSDNAAARAAAAALPSEGDEPTETERLRADVDYIAAMTGVEL